MSYFHSICSQLCSTRLGIKAYDTSEVKSHISLSSRIVVVLRPKSELDALCLVNTVTPKVDGEKEGRIINYRAPKRQHSGPDMNPIVTMLHAYDSKWVPPTCDQCRVIVFHETAIWEDRCFCCHHTSRLTATLDDFAIRSIYDASECIFFGKMSHL